MGLCYRLYIRFKSKIPQFRTIVSYFSELLYRFGVMHRTYNYEDFSDKFRKNETVYYANPAETEVLNNVKVWVQHSNFFGQSTQSADEYFSLESQPIRQTRTLPATPEYIPIKGSIQHQFQYEVVDRDYELALTEKPHNPVYQSLSAPVQGKQKPSEKDFDKIMNDYLAWIEAGKTGVTVRKRRKLPELPKPTSTNYGTFEHYLELSGGQQEEPTYAEVQRQINNYMFNGERNNYFQNYRPHVIIAEKVGMNSAENAQLRRDFHSNSTSMESSVDDYEIFRQAQRTPLNARSVSATVDDHRRSITQTIEENPRIKYLRALEMMSSSDQCTANSSFETTTSSQNEDDSNKVSKRFSKHFWDVADRHGKDSKAAKDTFHNRYFGKVGHHVVEMANRGSGEKIESDDDKEDDEKLKKKELARNAFRNGVHGETLEDGLEVEETRPPSITNDYWKTSRKHNHQYHHIF